MSLHVKLSIENEIQNIKLDGKRESRSTYTQTDEMALEVLKSKSSSATQTGEMARANIEYWRAKGNAPFAPPYACQIGSCMFKSSYKRLVQHLAEYHKDTFYEVLRLSDTLLFFLFQFSAFMVMKCLSFRFMNLVDNSRKLA